MKENFLIAFGIFIILIILSLFPIYRWLYGGPNEIREKVISNYEQEYNLILPRKDIGVGVYMMEYIGSSEWKNDIYFDGKFDLKTDYFNNQYVHNMKYDEKSIERYSNYILNAHLQYLKPFIVNELIYDKSKGNDFEKISKILEENKKEICKAFRVDDVEKCSIKFDIHLIKKEFSGVRYIKYNNVLFKIEDENIKYDDLIEQDILKEINPRPIKIKDMDWNKYLEKSKMYILLEIYAVEFDKENNLHYNRYSYVQDDMTVIQNEKLKHIFSKLEPYYNKEIFDFILDTDYRESKFTENEEVEKRNKEDIKILEEKGVILK